MPVPSMWKKNFSLGLASVERSMHGPSKIATSSAATGVEDSVYMYQPAEVPRVWSTEGPVPLDVVPPESRVQSKSSSEIFDHSPWPASKFSV